MLEKMKGQQPSMFEIASTACLLQFACNAKFTADFGKCYNDYPSLGSQLRRLSSG
jgi:hypothetical protein